MGQLSSKPWSFWKVAAHADCCMEDDSERTRIIVETGFSSRQVDRLHRRFTTLDRGCKGHLTLADIEAIPGMSDNPLGARIAAAMAREGKGGHDDDEGENGEIRITFRSFCKGFSHFSKTDVFGKTEGEDHEEVKRSRKRTKQGNPKGKLK